MGSSIGLGPASTVLRAASSVAAFVGLWICAHFLPSGPCSPSWALRFAGFGRIVMGDSDDHLPLRTYAMYVVDVSLGWINRPSPLSHLELEKGRKHPRAGLYNHIITSLCCAGESEINPPTALEKLQTKQFWACWVGCNNVCRCSLSGQL